MKFYNKIPIWENKQRLKLLNDFKNLITIYYENVSVPRRFASGYIENKNAKETRSQINAILEEVYCIIILTGINPNLVYTPPPITGGYTREINVIHNFCNLCQYDIEGSILQDFVERAIGIYTRNQSKAWIRTFNP